MCSALVGPRYLFGWTLCTLVEILNLCHGFVNNQQTDSVLQGLPELNSDNTDVTCDRPELSVLIENVDIKINILLVS